jgi:hypothetical protein
MMKKLLTIFTSFLVLALFSASSFGSTITSNGSGGGAWAANATWNGGVAPGSGDNVEIVSPDVVTLGADAQITNCQVDNGATLNISTFTLTLSGTVNLISGGTVNNNSGTMVFSGSQTSTGNLYTFGNLTWSSSLIATLFGNLTVNGNLTLLNCNQLKGTTGTAKTHTVAGNVIIDGNSAVLEGAVGSGTGSCIWNITGNVTTQNGGILRGSTGTTTTGNTSYNIGGNIVNNGTIDLTGGASAYANTLAFNGSTHQTISGNALTQIDGNQYLENVTMSNSSGVTLSTDMELTGTLALVSGSLNNGAHLTLDNASTINCSGGTLGTAPTFPTGFNLIYSGNVTTGNELPTAGELGQLTINTAGTVTLGASTTVTGTLTLTSGKLTTTAVHLLTLGSSTTVSGGSASSFINGPLAQSWTTATATKTYPLGKGATYRPLIVALTTPASPTLSAEVFNANADGSSALNAISIVRYYQTSLISGSAVSGGTVKITYGADDGVSDFAQLVVAQCTTVNGTYLSLGGSAADASSITSETAYNPGLGDFLLIGSTGANPLPVELTSFTALPGKNNVELAWATATEVNNYGFDIERKTANSQQLTANNQSLINNWTKVGFVDGHGTTNAPQSYSFTDASARVGKYSYRLKQIDHNGNFVYSQTVEATVSIMPGTIWLDNNYPNPFNPSTKISFVLGTKGHATLKVYSLLGQEVATLADGEFNDGEIQTFTFDASKYSSGIYYYQLKSGNGTQIKKMMLLK